MAEQAQQNPSQNSGVNRGILWFGQLGGPTAWMLHLMLTYGISEWGCNSSLARPSFLGITATAWLLLAWSAAMLAITGTAAWLAHSSERRLRQAEHFQEKVEETRHPGIYIARAGVITSSIFIFVISVETIPIFYFLQHC